MGVAGVAHEADHLAGLTCAPFDGERREGREVRVVELVPLASRSQSRLPAGAVPADREEGSVGDGDERLAELAEDVDPVLVGAAAVRACRSRRA